MIIHGDWTVNPCKSNISCDLAKVIGRITLISWHGFASNPIHSELVMVMGHDPFHKTRYSVPVSQLCSSWHELSWSNLGTTRSARVLTTHLACLWPMRAWRFCICVLYTLLQYLPDFAPFLALCQSPSLVLRDMNLAEVILALQEVREYLQPTWPVCGLCGPDAFAHVYILQYFAPFVSFGRQCPSLFSKILAAWPSLVGGLEHCLFFHMLGLILPTDELLFVRGLNGQPPVVLPWRFYHDPSMAPHEKVAKCVNPEAPPNINHARSLP